MVPLEFDHCNNVVGDAGQLSPTASSASLTSIWYAATGATGYDVKQGATGTVTTVSVGTSYSFSGLGAGTEHMLYVRAKSGSATSAWASHSAITGPAAPTGLRTTPVYVNLQRGTASMTLSWNGIRGATSCEVKRHGGPTATVPASGRSATFTGRPPSPYTLYVRAKNRGGTSGWSSITETPRFVEVGR